MTIAINAQTAISSRCLRSTFTNPINDVSSRARLRSGSILDRVRVPLRLMAASWSRLSAAGSGMHRPDALDRDVDDTEKNCSRAHRRKKECRPKPCNDRESSEHQVDREYCRAHGGVTSSCLNHSLISVAVMRVVPPLTVCDATAQRHGRVEHKRA